MTLFRASAQPLGGRRDDQGWGAFADAGVEIVEVPGNHDSCVAEPHVRRLAGRLNVALAVPRRGLIGYVPRRRANNRMPSPAIAVIDPYMAHCG